MKRKILSYILFKILKLNPDEFLPDKYRFLYWIFYPIHNWHYKYCNIKYDFASNALMVDGIKISRILIHELQNFTGNRKIIDGKLYLEIGNE